MSVAVRQAIGSQKGRRSWEKLVGYTAVDLLAHLEALFLPGMSWALVLKGAIEIDHVQPRSSFTYTTAEDLQFKQCWALSNLRPLWADLNRAKGARLDWKPPCHQDQTTALARRRRKQR